VRRLLVALGLGVAAALSAPVAGLRSSTAAPAALDTGGPAVLVSRHVEDDSDSSRHRHDLDIRDSRAPGAIVTGSDLHPGSVVSNTVRIKVIEALRIRLSEKDVVHGGPPGSGNLARDLQLTVVDTTTGRTVYTGALDSLSRTTVCGKHGDHDDDHAPRCVGWSNGEAHDLTFTVSFPSSGTSADNVYQGTSASVTFVWTGDGA
jgi:hypothetical protein